MIINIFQLDWVFIDSVIIGILVFILISVKLYKNAYRWRSFYSNESLESIYFKKMPIILKTQSIFPSKICIIKNKHMDHTKTSYPVIFFLRTSYKQKIPRILAEGLSSYGYSVIIIRFKVKPCPGCDLLDSLVTNEIKYVLSSIINYLKDNDIISNKNFISLNCGKSLLAYDAILIDKALGTVIINPILNEFTIRNFNASTNKADLASRMHIIFSEKTLLISKNDDLRKFKERFSKSTSNNLNFLEITGASKSFKYYETLLLGILIDLIEKIRSKG